MGAGETGLSSSEGLSHHLQVLPSLFYGQLQVQSTLSRSLVFQRLHHQQKRPESTALDWKFSELFGKTKKSEHDELLIEYLNMLATTIQASFKGYLVRKRHKLASQRLNRFMSLLGAAAKGWKTRNVLRCLKIKEEARSLGFKRLEAEKEARTNDNPRRLDYLKRSLKA